MRRRDWVQIAAVTLSGNSLRQTVDTHRASVHQAAKLVATLLRVAGVTAGLAESNGSLPPGLWLTSPAGWLPKTGISSGTLRSVIECGLPFFALNAPLSQSFTALQIKHLHLSGLTVLVPSPDGRNAYGRKGQTDRHWAIYRVVSRNLPPDMCPRTSTPEKFYPDILSPRLGL